MAAASMASPAHLHGFISRRIPRVRCHGFGALRLFQLSRISCSASKNFPRAASMTALEGGISNVDYVPTPMVMIDQDSEPNATIVEIIFGDLLGHSLILSTGRKIEDPELLEAIRLTIISNMLQYHPESSGKLAMGAVFGVEAPEQQIDMDIVTHIDICDDGPYKSLLVVETLDRPGLLVDLVKIISDINVTVQSGEFDTEGLLAKAKFHVSYRDKPIVKNLQMVLANSLRYFLRRPTTEDASF